MPSWSPMRTRCSSHELALAASLFEARRRHAEHFGAVLRAANQMFLSPGSGAVDGLGLYDAERLNVDRAWRWLGEHANDPLIAPLCGEFPNQGSYILSLRLPAATWRSWLSIALTAARAAGAGRLEASHLGNLGVAARRLGDVDEAIARFEEQRRLASELELVQLEATAEGNLGLCYADKDELTRAITCQEASLRLSKSVGHRRGEANALGNLGNAHADLGDQGAARSRYEAQLVIVRDLGDNQGEANVLGNLGLLAFDAGDASGAMQYFDLQLGLCRRIGDRVGEGNALFSYGKAHKLGGRIDLAVELAQAGLSILEETGHHFALEARQFLDELGPAPPRAPSAEP